MGKSKKKVKAKQTDEFYEQLVKSNDEPGWQTGPVADMAVDDAAGAAGSEPPREAAASTSGKRTEGMQLDKPAGKKRKLGVAISSLKRGQRTKAQRLRKVDKLEKAMARVDKVGVRLSGEQTNKIRKLSLKHMY